MNWIPGSNQMIPEPHGLPIGNHRVQVNEVIDKENNTKETSCNVGEDKINAFENEWSLIQFESLNKNPTIKSKNDEAKE